jgi:2,4-dienoyl-CoA reductase-like NADH-dependent reductase (Old Yellow Enzyme family)
MLLAPFIDPNLGELKSRIAMAAMTRAFCGPNHTATRKMAEYYAARACNGVGLILTEGTIIHHSADGYNNVPYIETSEQCDSWRQVTNAVHAEGGKIFCQLWHCGRISHTDYTGGVPPLSSTNVAASGVNRQNNKPFGQPKAMTQRDIEEVIAQFVAAARNAMAAGFDGVELHCGHGYLIDQFFDSRINDRTDAYGGSVPNRCRFGLEVIGAVVESIGSSAVMARLSPSRDMGGLYDWPDLHDMLDYVIPAAHASGLRMLDISCANADYYATSGRIIRSVRKAWPGFLVGGASLSQEQAEAELKDGWLDMVTWGRALIANRDMPLRFQAGCSLMDFSRDMLATLD